MCTIWIISIAFLVAANCGLVGTFLMLRKKAILGDAIAHALLLGVVLSFLVTGSTHFLLFLLGALWAALVAMWLMQIIEKELRVHAEAAIGIVFTTFFALGVILIALYTEKVDLDQGCVLYGHLITALFDKTTLYGTLLVPKAIFTLGLLLLINASIIFLAYTPLVISTFDPNMAASIGIQNRQYDYLLIGLTSLTAVLSLKIVGVPLVTTFLIVPPATAYLLTHHLPTLLGYTLLIDGLVALFGYTLAVLVNASVPGGMAVVAGCCFATIFLITTSKRNQ